MTAAWQITLAAGGVVILVVAVLLELIVRAARTIRELVSDIWTGGKQVAGNTQTIGLLGRTNYLARQLLGSAAGVREAATRLRRGTERPS